MPRSRILEAFFIPYFVLVSDVPFLSVFFFIHCFVSPSSCPRSRMLRCRSHVTYRYVTALTSKFKSQYSDWPRDLSSSPGRSKIFLLSTSSSPVLGPTQPPLHRLPGIKRLGGQADHSVCSPPTFSWHSAELVKHRNSVLQVWILLMEVMHWNCIFCSFIYVLFYLQAADSLIMYSFPSALQLMVSFGLLNNQPPFLSVLHLLRRWSVEW
jgi:hypothetical protein